MAVVADLTRSEDHPNLKPGGRHARGLPSVLRRLCFFRLSSPTSRWALIIAGGGVQPRQTGGRRRWFMSHGPFGGRRAQPHPPAARPRQNTSPRPRARRRTCARATPAQTAALRWWCGGWPRCDALRGCVAVVWGGGEPPDDVTHAHAHNGNCKRKPQTKPRGADQRELRRSCRADADVFRSARRRAARAHM